MSRRQRFKPWQRIAMIVLVILLSIGLMLPSFMGIAGFIG